MLERGGNAVDAAVASGFVAGVVEPMETTLAGSGFMLVHPPEGVAHAIEFGPRAPAAARVDMFTIDESRKIDRGLGVSVVEGDANVQGIAAAGVPGTIAGLLDAQARFGRLPLAAVLAPAIRAAHDGFGSMDTSHSRPWPTSMPCAVTAVLQSSFSPTASRML